MKKEHAKSFIDHLNTIDEDIQWTTEGEVNGELAFIDCCTIRTEDGTIKTKVYRKATHTNQYLNWESNHPVDHKVGVVRTLHHRADNIVSDPVELQGELTEIHQALSICGYPKWALQRKDHSSKTPSKDNAQAGDKKKRQPIVIPYVKDVSEQLRRIFKQYDIPAFFKPVNTIRQQLVRPKDPISKEKVCGPIYHIPCSKCDATYIGETERSLRTRFMEHRRPSSINSEVSRHIHTDKPEHQVDIKTVKILGTEPRWFERGVKEAIHIRVNKPSLNRDGGRFNLPAVWNNLLRDRIPKVHEPEERGTRRAEPPKPPDPLYHH